MFAVVKTCGKQYKVEKNSYISVEKLPLNVGDEHVIENVLMISNDNNNVVFGTPNVAGAKVISVVVAQKREKTVLIFKKKRRKHHRRKNGHRQPKTIIQVKEIIG